MPVKQQARHDTENRDSRGGIDPFNIAIILAGGCGHRANAARIATRSNQEPKQPKQLWLLNGRPVWQHSWLRFAQHPQIHYIYLVWPQFYIEQIRWEVSKHQTEGLAPCTVIAGGWERSDSTLRALAYCQQWQHLGQRIQVLIHDAARPLLSERMIRETIEKLETSSVVVCAIPAQDSLFIQNPEKDQVLRILERSTIMQSQTPQGFNLEVLTRAFARHRQRNEIVVTDDISVVKHYLPDQHIAIVAGEKRNMKLTQADDIQVLEAYCQL